MSKRFQLLKNSVPVIIVTEEDVDKYYQKYDADQVVEINDEIEEQSVKIQGIIYVVVYYDIGETCDGHIRKLGQYSSKELAQNMLKKDMEYQLEKHTYWHACNNEVTNEDCTEGCVYDIIEVEY